jgi:hypothetical protein
MKKGGVVRTREFRIELKRQIADAGHVLIVVVDDNPYVC